MSGESLGEYHDKKNKRKCFDKFVKFIEISANLAIIGGIIFAAIQISMVKNNEKRRIAIDVISITKSLEFLKSQTRLKVGLNHPEYDDSNSLFLFDLNYVLNTYDIISVFYLADIADKCIIKYGVFDTAIEFQKNLDASDYAKDKRAIFDNFINMMQEIDCDLISFDISFYGGNHA